MVVEQAMEPDLVLLTIMGKAWFATQSATPVLSMRVRRALPSPTHAVTPSSLAASMAPSSRLPPVGSSWCLEVALSSVFPWRGDNNRLSYLVCSSGGFPSHTRIQSSRIKDFLYVDLPSTTSLSEREGTQGGYGPSRTAYDRMGRVFSL